MCVKCPNVVIPDYSPDGTCVLVINTLFSGDDWKEVKVADYYKIKNKIAENLIDVFERKLNVSIKEHIEEIEIVTPITYINYLNSPAVFTDI